MTGQYPGDRATGRSTAEALEQIAHAIKNPGRPHKISDHSGLRAGIEHTRFQMCNMVRSLGLKHFTFTADTVRFG